MDERTILALGYYRAKPLSNGEWLALQRMLYTTGLFIVVDEDWWRTRFCYERSADAEAAFAVWDGLGDPPGMWIKQKPQDRLNPRWLDEAKADMQERA